MGNFKGIILEGVSGSGKTEVFRNLIKIAGAGQISGGLVLSEAHTIRPLEGIARKGRPMAGDCRDLLNSHLDYFIKTKRRWENAEWPHKPPGENLFIAIFERFHLTCHLQFPGVSWQDIASIDMRLAENDFLLVLLTAGKEAIKNRAVESRLGNKNWMSYISRFGKDADEIAGHFCGVQKKLKELAVSGAVKHIEIDTTGISPLEISKIIMKKL